MSDRMIRTYGSKGCENLTRLAVVAALLTLGACGGGGSGSGSTFGSIDENIDLDLSNLQEIPLAIGAATDGSFEAASDAAEAAAGETIAVGIFNNDSVPEGTQFQLLSQPENGFAELLDSGELAYTANSGYEGTDRVEYALVAPDGSVSTGSLFVVVCADCDLSEPAVAAASPGFDESGNPFCASPTADPDGDGFGWENNNTCRVAPDGVSVGGSLTANADSLTLDAGTTSAVSAFRNDVIAERSSVEFDIDVEPVNGRIEAADAGVVVYTAPDDFEGTDSLVYRLTDRAGNTSVASIDFNIECAWCVNMRGLRLSWPANSASENVESYRVFFGPDENTHTSTALTEVRASSFSGSAPHTIFDIENDLNLTGSEGGCFRVTAVRGSEESEPSNAVCFNLG